MNDPIRLHFVDIDAMRADIADVLADENGRHRLHEELRWSMGLTDDQLGLWSRLIAAFVGAVPDRLARFAAATPGPGAVAQVQRVLSAVGKYWVQADDIIPDARGLVGRIDDAAVVHDLIDRLSTFHIAKESVELVADEGLPDSNVREKLSYEVSRAVEAVVDSIWYDTFDGTDITPLGPSIEVFTPLGGEVVVMPRLRPAAADDQIDEAVFVPADGGLCRIWFGTNRAPVDADDLSKGFGVVSARNGKVRYGVCDVAIPKSHRFGSTGTVWWKRWLRFEFTSDQIKVIRRKALHGSDAFFGDLRHELVRTEGKQVLFYLHGYNVDFEDAAVRAAQLFADLKVDGAAAFFSWPSQGATGGYLVDGQRIEESERAITDFLIGLATRLGDVTMHVIAHSMGNRAFARAIQRITGTAAQGAAVRFGQIILAAPDISPEVFKDLACVYPSISTRTTMYVSRGDKALGMSKLLQSTARAGFSPPVTVVPGIDTVEVTDVDLTMLGHSYYAEAAAVLYDIDELLKHNADPGLRLRLRRGPALNPPQPYWVIGE